MAPVSDSCLSLLARMVSSELSNSPNFHKMASSLKEHLCGDPVVLQVDDLVHTKSLLSKVIEVLPGSGGMICEVTIKTSTVTYWRPIPKVTLLLPSQE